MLATIRDMILGAAIAGLAGAAFAVGIAPNPGGYVQPDAAWLNGVAAGQNSTYQYGLTALGTTQGTAAQLPAAISLMEVDTAAAVSAGVALPPAVAGTDISIYDNTANAVTVYPSIANNGITAAQDTINNGTSTFIVGRSALYCFSAKTGLWACK